MTNEKYEKKRKQFKKSIESNQSVYLTRKYTTRIYPDNRQIEQLNQELGNYRFIYNYTLDFLYDRFKNDEKLDYSGFDLINKLIPELKSKFDWIDKSSSQSNQHAITEAREAFWKWLTNLKKTNAKRKASHKKIKDKPNFKRKHQDRQSYHVSNQMIYNVNFDNSVARLAKLGDIRFYYRGLPDKSRISKICDSRIIRKNGSYYLLLSLIIAKDFFKTYGKYSKPIGIDWGIHTLATIADGKEFRTINSFLKKKGKKIIKNQESEIYQLQDKISSLQKIIQHKVDVNKKRKLEDPYHTRNIEKLWMKVRKLYDRISNLKLDYLNKSVYNLVKNKPRYIQIEDLKVADSLMKQPNGTAKDKHIRKLMLQSSPYQFRQKLMDKCQEFNVELRAIPSTYPSSQICSQCGMKHEIELSQRVFKCPHCGYKADRDQNASINILNCKEYSVLIDAFGMLVS